MSVDLKVGIDKKHWLREVERGRKMAQQAMNKSGAEMKLKINEKGFRQPLGRITGDLKQFDSALAASNARVIAFGASTAVIGGISKAFRELAKTTIEVGKAFADINRILQMSNKDLSKFGNELFAIGKKNATAFEDTTKAALEFARQGLKTEETLKRTSDALTLVRLTGINADKAVSSLTATVNAFDNAMVTTTSSVNKFVAVETKFAVGARDLVEAIGRVGSSAKDAKVGFDELNAMVTAVQQTTGRGGAVIGNAMKTIFTRLQRASTLEALESYGVAVRDIEGATLPAINILNNFAKSYKGLADQNQAYLREQVAGVFQANILSAILRDLNKQQSTFSQALKVSVGATNEADQATAQLNKTLSSLASQTGLEFKRLQENIGKATFEPIAKALLDPLQSLMKGINDIIDGEGAGSEIANGLLKGIKNVIGGPGLVAIVGLIGKVFINTTGYLLQSLPALAGITTQTQKRAQFEQIIESAMRSESGLAGLIAAEEGNAAVQAGIFAQHAEAARQDLKAQEKSVKAIAAALMTMPKTTQAAVMGPKKRTGRGAGGFIPGIAGEAHDIKRGVGGVSSSAKPVAIPNFAFGGGVRGTMIANSGEHIVPNFKGGGSAIFNPNMIAQYGMPAGAKPIRGAGGYVPNFVDVNKANAGQMAREAGITQSSHPSLFTKGGDIRVAALRSNLKRKSGAKAASGKFLDATSVAHMLIPQAGAKYLRHPHIFGGGKSGPSKAKMLAKSMTGKDVDGVILNAYGPSPSASKKVQGGGNIMEVEKILDDSLTMAAENVIMAYHPSLAEVPINKKKIETSFLREGGEGAMGAFKGALFEAIVTRLIKQPQEKGKSQSNTLDVNLGHPTAGPRTRDLFGIPKTDKAGFADLKSSWSSGNRSKIVEQIIKNFGPMLKVTSAAQGYIPNFAALGDSVERELAAGVPMGSIRVGRSSKLAGPNNPAGLGVTNTRDEPRGLADVVGASQGYVPNYALKLPAGLTAKKGKGHTALIDKLQEQLARELNDAINDYRKGNMSREQLNAKTKQLTSSMQLTNAAEKKVTAAVNRRAMAADRLGPAKSFTGRMSALNTRMSRGGMGGMGIGMGLSMGAPMLAGAVEQGFGEGNATGQVISGALTGAGTGAAIGMMFGPLGAAIGGAGGALIGFATSAMDAGKSLEQLERETKEYTQETEGNINAAQEYIQAQRDIASALTPEELENAQKRLVKNFDAIKNVELQNKFAEAGTNIEGMISSLKDYEMSRRGEAIVGTAAMRAKRIVEERGKLETQGHFDIGKEAVDKNRFMKFERGLPDQFGGNRRYRFSMDDIALGNLKKEYGEFFDLLKTSLSPDQLTELSDMLADQADDVVFNDEHLAEFLIASSENFTQNMQDNLQEMFQNMASSMTANRLFRKGLVDQDLQGFEMLVNMVTAFAGKTKSAVTGINTQAEKALESFIDIKSSVTRLSETLGAMAKSIDNISKVRKAFTAQRIDLLGSAGAGLSIGAFAQGQSTAGFADQRSKLTATTAQGNATKIMDAIKSAQGATGDANLRNLQAAADIFSQDINAGLDAFAKFTSANSTEQEKLTKLINKLRITYNDQVTNINLDEKLTQSKNELEQKRRENTEKQAILTDAMGAVENRRAMNLVDENAKRQSGINKLQGRLDDPRNFRGTGFKTASGRITARAGIEQQIADLQFQGRQAEATQGSVQRANALIVQQQQVKLDSELLKSETSLIQVMNELIFEYKKQSDLVAMGSRPDFTEEDAKRMGYTSVRGAQLAGADLLDTPSQSAFDAERKSILNRPSELNTNRAGNPRLPDNFNYDAEEKAAENLAKTLENVKTQKEVIDVLEKRRSQLDDENQVDKAEKRRIDTLLRQINLGKQKLTTEKKNSDELRQQTKDRKVSLDQDARSFKTGFKEGMLDIFEETDYIYARLGKDLPTAFRDGMVGAMESAMDKAESFGDAIRGVAIDMLKMIRRASLESSMSNFTNLLGMGTEGFRKSQNGSFVPGSGTGDKVPSLLEPGEYVMNRNAVKGIGKANLDKMNFGAFPRFATGGSMGLDESVHSSRMSGYFLASDNPELAEAREAERERLAKKAQKKAEKKALKQQIISSLVSAGIGQAVQMGSDALKNRQLQNAGATKLSSLPKSQASAIKSEITFAGGKDAYAMQQGYSSWMDLEQSGALLNPNKSSFLTADTRRRQKGGHIGGGFTNRDSVPAYMAGGEFVMNNRAVRKYGLGFMGRLNGGVIPTMQAGGGVEAAPLNAQTGANTNNISINVSVGGGAGEGSTSQGASNSSGNANASQQSNVDEATKAKAMSERIRSAVLEVIGQEQRLGGSLSKNARQP